MDQETLLQFFPESLRGLIVANDISDVMVNEDGQVFVDRNGLLENTGLALRSGSLIMGIQNIARQKGMEFDYSQPFLEVQLPDGARLAAVYHNGLVTLTIRKFNRWYSTDELVEIGCLTHAVRDMLVDGIRGTSWRGKTNILVSGGTSSGKTTLAKALLDHIPPTERLVVIEKPSELFISHPNAVRWEATSGSPGGGPPISVAQLLVASLRHRPDRIILGEVREPDAAYELLQALNTGHAGSICTIHADSSEDAFYRLIDLVLASHSNLAREFVQKQVLRSIGLIVHLKRINGVRQVTEVSVGKPEQGSFSKVYSSPLTGDIHNAGTYQHLPI